MPQPAVADALLRRNRSQKKDYNSTEILTIITRFYVFSIVNGFQRFSFYQFSKHEDNNFGLTNSKNVVIRFEKNISVKLHFILSRLTERFCSIVYFILAGIFDYD